MPLKFLRIEHQNDFPPACEQHRLEKKILLLGFCESLCKNDLNFPRRKISRNVEEAFN